MNRLLTAITATLIALNVCAFTPPYDLQIDDVHTLSSFTLTSRDDNKGEYTYTVTNSDPSVPAFINFKATTQKLDQPLRMVTFEYRASAPGNPRTLGTLVNLNFVRATGSATNLLYHQNTYTSEPSGDHWYRMTFDIGAERDNGIGFGKLKGHTLWLHFVGIPAGTQITIRNPKIAEYEFAQQPTPIDPEQTTLIAPESFNIGLHNGYGHHSNLHINEAPVPYYNPAVDERFPILAWCGVEPHTVNGSIDWDRLQSDFKDYWDCGFSLAMPTSNPQVNTHSIHNDIGRFLFDNTGLKMFLKPSDLTDDEIKYHATSDRLAGWFIRDEPFVFNLDEMRQNVDRVTSLDNTHLLYGNIFGAQGADMSATGARDYQDYVNQYLTQVGIGYLSYDFYPVRQYIATGERFIHPYFFYNLEFASRISRQHAIPFWGFVHSVESNCSVEGTKYPYPSLEEMKIEAFCALAYGAQGIQYFTYGTPYDPEYNYCNAPLDADGNLTPVWDMVKSVNDDINALRQVFLGAKTLWVANTAASTPIGCRQLTDNMLPQGIAAITSDSDRGLCISRLVNSANDYLMIVNPDLATTQNINISNAVSFRQITPQGVINCQSDIFTLAPGDYIILLLNDNLKPSEPQTKPIVNTDSRLLDSRDAYTGIDLRRNSAGQTYINHMGNPDLAGFTLTETTAADITITPRQAADNFGAWFNYTINVATDGNYDLSVLHAVPWDTYRRVASRTIPYNLDGSICADYNLDYDNSVNWPAQFAASMLLEIDGNVINPSNQPSYPALPNADDIDGTIYNAMLSDPSQWITVGTTSQPEQLNAALRFWPRGGDNTPIPGKHDKPDYTNVYLTQGEHTLTVRSLCSPWNFYGIEVSTTSTSGIDDIIDTTDTRQPVVMYDMRGVRINPDAAVPGLYIIKQGTSIHKIKL